MMPDPWILGTIGAALGLLIGCHPTIAEASRKSYVRSNPRLFPGQYEELMSA